MCSTKKRFVGPALLTTTDTVLYEVPEGCKAVIRSVVADNTSSVAVILSIGPDGSGARIVHRVLQDELASTYIVLESGETLQGSASSSGVTLTVSGEELSL